MHQWISSTPGEDLVDFEFTRRRPSEFRRRSSRLRGRQGSPEVNMAWRRVTGGRRWLASGQCGMEGDGDGRRGMDARMARGFDCDGGGFDCDGRGAGVSSMMVDGGRWYARVSTL
ncbi:hypothetical protein RHGRI_025832 [Rhododendron griersonianum]|uniref:Uncharacterized protein n=1 Tax=Rhododendron griersonianum TaxID=479676 RepID=A0AAV6IQQ3_9ERIC|nr:hypothetical protein RHGRI_025832 [Rhododendron griersonianum]